MTIELKRNPLIDTWECKLFLEARISHQTSAHTLGGFVHETLMYAPTLPIILSFSEEFFKQDDPEAIIRYVQSRVQSVWTQAVAVMAGKYTDLLIEALTPGIQEILELAQAKKNGDLL